MTYGSIWSVSALLRCEFLPAPDTPSARPKGAPSLQPVSVQGALCPISDLFFFSVPVPYTGATQCSERSCFPTPLSPPHETDCSEYIWSCCAIFFFKPSFPCSLPLFFFFPTSPAGLDYNVRPYWLQLRSGCDPRNGIAARDGDDTFMALGLIKQLLTLFSP